MTVKPGRAQVRPTAKANPQAPRMQHKAFPAPTRGWIANENLALSQPAGALMLENWIPTSTGIRSRGGSLKHATISTGPVLRMWTYKSGDVEEFFASDATKIFNITTVADADVIPTPVVTGQTSGYYSTAQFGTAGGDYQSIVNGTDTPKLYDGSTFANHAFTGLATPQDLSFVWSFANRLFYIRKNTMSVYYLPVDSINGALSEFSLAGIFQEGGSLLCGGKWSMDSGDGLDDKWVVISTTGEVAVYQGTNPGSATDWQKVGVYQITGPMGPNATMQAGGDLLIGTKDGIVPISAAVDKDIAALSLAAVTASIEPEWKAEVVARSSLPWEIIKWPTNNLMVVSLPVPNDTIAPYCFAANLETGAWAGRITGWNTRCIALFADQGYFGTNTGTIHAMEVGGSDDGENYTCKYVGLPDHLDAPGVTKTIHQARSIFKSTCPFDAQISASVDYTVDLPGIPSSTADFIQDVWDVGLWDVAIWDAGTASTISTQWVSVGKTGFVFMPQVQITFGVTPKPVTELVAFDVLYENGGVMT
ncbi:hypothetical protein LPB79_13225 [Rhizobium sp. T136]|uniref:hypothetical protein n=1 Tax=Rhizobium sp. T136 TaxID=555319 RepID=UPI001E2E2D92|nr:hypothetical protein [Rhizobium sp. T136]UFS83209.1 hypothetical protein LPB79_13225 [Rhizobium sp. T136]